MAKKKLTDEQKKLDTDLWIIALVTFSVFLGYMATAKPLVLFVNDQSIPILPRLLCNAAVQYGISGLGITIVCILRRESFARFGLVQKNLLWAAAGTALCFVPYIVYVFASGSFEGYRPFHIFVAKDVCAAGFPISVLGMALIVIVWGFFEGFNYAVICEKINRRYPPRNFWLDPGACFCAVVCILFHPFSTSFWGLVEIATTILAIYGMLLVRKKTGNAWGCVLAFCLIWNAI